MKRGTNTKGNRLIQVKADEPSGSTIPSFHRRPNLSAQTNTEQLYGRITKSACVIGGGGGYLDAQECMGGFLYNNSTLKLYFAVCICFERGNKLDEYLCLYD